MDINAVHSALDKIEALRDLQRESAATLVKMEVALCQMILYGDSLKGKVVRSAWASQRSGLAPVYQLWVDGAMNEFKISTLPKALIDSAPDWVKMHYNMHKRRQQSPTS